MASALKNLSSFSETEVPSASSFTFGIVVSEWNKDVTGRLFDGCYNSLREHGMEEGNIHTIQVPGSFELPSGAKILASSKRLDAVICLGCIIKGETRHDEYISQAVATGIMGLGLTSGIPVIFGVLTTENLEQALDRAGGKHGNKGVEAAVTAIRMAALKKEVGRPAGRIGY